MRVRAAVVGHVEALGEGGWQAMAVWRWVALRVGRSHDLQVGHSAGWRSFLPSDGGEAEGCDARRCHSLIAHMERMETVRRSGCRARLRVAGRDLRSLNSNAGPWAVFALGLSGVILRPSRGPCPFRSSSRVNFLYLALS